MENQPTSDRTACVPVLTGRRVGLTTVLVRTVFGGIAWSKYRSRQAKPADPGITTLSPSRTLFVAPSIIAWFQGPGVSTGMRVPAHRGRCHDATDSPDYRSPERTGRCHPDPGRDRHLSGAPVKTSLCMRIPIIGGGDHPRGRTRSCRYARPGKCRATVRYPPRSTIR